jgi:PAS domain S-box-containing protein
MQRGSMKKHRAVLDAVRDAVFLADIDTGMIVDANPAAETLCGRSLWELQFLHLAGLYPPEVRESVRRAFEKRTRVLGLTDGLVLHKDGHLIPVEIASIHFTAPDGKRILVGVFHLQTGDSFDRSRYN